MCRYIIYTRLKVENQNVTFEFVCFFQYLLKLVFTTPIQIVSKLYLVDLIFILLIFKEQVRWFSVEAKRKEFNCVINEDIAYDMTM